MLGLGPGPYKHAPAVQGLGPPAEPVGHLQASPARPIGKFLPRAAIAHPSYLVVEVRDKADKRAAPGPSES